MKHSHRLLFHSVINRNKLLKPYKTKLVQWEKIWQPASLTFNKKVFDVVYTIYFVQGQCQQLWRYCVCVQTIADFSLYLSVINDNERENAYQSQAMLFKCFLLRNKVIFFQLLGWFFFLRLCNSREIKYTSKWNELFFSWCKCKSWVEMNLRKKNFEHGQQM